MVRIQRHSSVNGEGERKKERAVYTLCKALPNSSPWTKYKYFSLKETAMVCIIWLQSYMYNRTTNYSELGMVATRTWLWIHFYAHVHVAPIPGHATCTWRQMHRWPSRHYVYYIMPRLKFKGEKEGMADRTVSTQIKYPPTLLSLQIRCVLVAALENIL